MHSKRPRIDYRRPWISIPSAHGQAGQGLGWPPSDLRRPHPSSLTHLTSIIKFSDIKRVGSRAMRGGRHFPFPRPPEGHPGGCLESIGRLQEEELGLTPQLKAELQKVDPDSTW